MTQIDTSTKHILDSWILQFFRFRRSRSRLQEDGQKVFQNVDLDPEEYDMMGGKTIFSKRLGRIFSADGTTSNWSKPMCH